MKKRFHHKLKIGHLISLHGNAYFHMLGLTYATGIVTQVRAPGDGFVFKCNETRTLEAVEDGDGELRFLERNNYFETRS